MEPQYWYKKSRAEHVYNPSTGEVGAGGCRPATLAEMVNSRLNEKRYQNTRWRVMRKIPSPDAWTPQRGYSTLKRVYLYAYNTHTQFLTYASIILSDTGIQISQQILYKVLLCVGTRENNEFTLQNKLFRVPRFGFLSMTRLDCM